MIFSFSTSSEEDISSKIIIGASFKIALAMESLCLSPPERDAPFSPIIVSYPFSMFPIKSSHPASAAAFLTSSSVAFIFPILIFSMTVLLNKVTS